jgi:polyphosphate kinase
MSKLHKNQYHSRELSWLSFNERVLQEAEDLANPLGERIKFLGINSSNFDEFFQVRVSNLKRLCLMGERSMEPTGEDPHAMMKRLQEIYLKQRNRFETICEAALGEMESHGVRLMTVDNLSDGQKDFILEYFNREVRPNIFPIMLNTRYRFPDLRDAAIYLAVELIHHTGSGKDQTRYSLVEIPTNVLPRFMKIPSEPGRNDLIMIDEVVRLGLDTIFRPLGFEQCDAYNIKVTRDAEFDVDEDVYTSYLDKLDRGLQLRSEGDIIRFIYDRRMPERMLALFKKKIGLHRLDTLSPGGRYHYFRDFIGLPKIAGLPMTPRPEPLDHPDINPHKRLLDSVAEKDILLHFPYHSFHTIIDLLREASLDPRVEQIQVTIYRVAPDSSIMNALVNARKNRKEVTVLLELQARFDEKNNLRWAETLRNEGIRVIYGVRGLKVHSKLLLITGKEGKKRIRYACIGSGNLNEDTATIYTDFFLLTARPEITDEVLRVFDFFTANYRLNPFRRLVVSPFSFREKMTALIDREIRLVKKGRSGMIDLKLNNLADQALVDKLYQASRAGVKIRIICRGRFYPVTGVPGCSENIEAISIVDKYLEHARFYIFHNGGDPDVYFGSADWQTRNIDRRVEVTCPLHEEQHIRQVMDLFLLQWHDNTKARILDRELSNSYRERLPGEPSRRCQEETHEYLKSMASK